MLLSPFSDQPYKPTLHYFLGGFDVYDREETLGEELNKYDPNDKEDREFLITRFFMEREKNLSYRHRYVLLTVLDNALGDSSYDFSSVLEHDPEEYSCLPWDWDIKEPRVFFEDILRIAKEAWKDDLHKASLEDQSTW